MAALKNPYLSQDSQNFLLRKNFNVIKSPQKSTLYTQYSSNVGKTNYNVNQKQKYKNQNSLTSIGNTSSALSLKNPFSSNTLGQRNQNFPYYHQNIPSFYTQPYLTQAQKKELPFPSYNRPQSNRPTSSSRNKNSFQLSLSKRNMAVSNAQSSSLQKNLNSPYRPHFISPFTKNDWNTQRWKKDLQKQERQKLKKFGPDALRFQNSVSNKFHSNNFNNDYYSTKEVGYSVNTNKTKVQAKTYAEKQKRKQAITNKQTPQQDSQLYTYRISSNNFPKHQSANQRFPRKDPDNYLKNPSKKQRSIFKDQIHEAESSIENFESKIQNFNSDSNFGKNSRHHIDGNKIHLYRDSSMMEEEFKSFVKDDDQEIDDYGRTKFQSKYQNRENIKKISKKGPLDLDAFDSGGDHHFQKNQMLDSKKSNFGTGLTSGKFGMAKNNQFRQEQSEIMQRQFQSKASFGQNYTRNRKKSFQRTNHMPNKDYPQKLQFKNQFFYRIRLNSNKKD